MKCRMQWIGAAALLVSLSGMSLPLAHSYWSRGRVYPSMIGRHYSPSTALPHHPYWGCFGPCYGPLNPNHHHHYWTCYGYCPGPLPPYHHFGGCYSPCPLPYPNPPVYLCYGYCPLPPPPVVVQPIQPIYNITYPAGDTTYPAYTPPAPPKESTTEFEDGKSLDDWIKMLKTGDAKARASACVAIREMGRTAKEAIPALVAALKDTDPYVRIEATVALGAIGPAAIPALTEALKSSNRYQRMGACLSLGHMAANAKDAIPALEAAFKDKNASVRAHAAQAVWRIDRTRAGDIVSVLADALKDDNRAVKMGAVITLGQIGKAAKDAVPALRPLLGSDDPELCIKAALTLYQIDPKDAADAAKALIGAFDNKDVSIQAESAAALCELGANAKDVVPALGKALVGPDEMRSHVAAQTLGAIGKAAVPALVEGLQSNKADVRWDVLTALGNIGPDASAAALPVAAVLTDADPSFRTEAARTLGRIGSGAKAAVPALAKALKDEMVTVRLHAAEALGQIGPEAKEAIPELKAALKDKSDDVSSAAEDALARINGKGEK